MPEYYESKLENRLAAQATHRAMGTVMTHKAFGLCTEDSLKAVCREVSRIEELLSCFLPASEISRVNGSAGIKSEKISLETYDALSKAVKCTGGQMEMRHAIVVGSGAGGAFRPFALS